MKQATQKGGHFGQSLSARALYYFSFYYVGRSVHGKVPLKA